MLPHFSTGDEMQMIPPPPESKPEPAVVVLGRFQPLHKGHTYLLRKAAVFRDAEHPDLVLRIMLGSSNREQSPENPWDWEERSEMVANWVTSEGLENVEILAVPDLGDEEKWVEHASAWHGDAGVLVVSHEQTEQLYSDAGWAIHRVDLDERESLEGWRVRQTLKMMSTINDEDAFRMVLGESVEEVIIDWMLSEPERIKRLAFLGPAVEHVG